MKKLKFALLLAISLSILLLNACVKNSDLRLCSPDGTYMFSLNLPEEAANPLYSISFNEEEIVGKSKLGFKLEGRHEGSERPVIEEVTRHSVSNQWKPVYGEKDEYPDIYNEAYFTFKGDFPYGLRVRAYNEGVAFQYEMKAQSAETVISDEITEFRLRPNANAWVSTRAQSAISKIKVSEIDAAMERPMLVQYSDSLFLAIGEAALVDFARMKFIGKDGHPGTLKAKLAGEVKYKNAIASPWRFVMAAKQAGKLLENNYLLLNLNEPNKISDPSWIKPGKVIREVTLTTQGGMACVDFAAKHNLQYVEFDAGWYGSEYDDASDATTITVDPKRSKGPLDLHKVIEYADSKNVGVLLYVNRRALEKQLDEVLPLLSSWGIKGVKYGFVNVGPQEWTYWLHEAVRKAADHNLMIDIHDEYRPTGYSRTYPNLMTQEGIRGDEESAPNDMVINTIFTRMIAGAGDQTNCYFAPRVAEKMGSHASQLAKTVCIYSPWQFLFWYDRPFGSRPNDEGAGGSKNYIKELPELTFYDQLPTVWDDTKVLDGYPGELAVIARRSESSWFLGAITGAKGHSLSVNLDFLEEGEKYLATIFTDDQALGTTTNVSIEEMEVSSSSVLKHNILKQNGLAVIIKPIRK